MNNVFRFRLTGLMADTLGSYTHAFYMSGAVVIAGACIPFLLLFTKTKDPCANEAMDEISVPVNPDDIGEETGTDLGSRGERRPAEDLSSVAVENSRL